MEDSIGNYIRRYLRNNGISNTEAGDAIGLSESAFEKVLMKDDIHINRLLKLSSYLDKNLLEYYYEKEPLVRFKKNEVADLLQKIEFLENSLQQQAKAIIDKDKIIEFQDKLISELEGKLNS